MAQERDEQNKRRREREARRKAREAQQRKLKIKLALIVVVLILCGVGIFQLTRDMAAAVAELDSAEVMATEETEAPATEETTASSRLANTGTTVIHIKAAGDLTVTDKVVASADTDLGYDYSGAFIDVAPLLADADLTMLNFEGNLIGAPYGTATASAPQELMTALADIGVDIVQMANSYSIYNGMIGLATTLNNIRAAGIEPVGAFATNAEFKSSKGYTICNVQGIKVAVVAFTKGMGGLGLPAGSENCVNVLYTDYATTYREINKEGITSILKNLANEEPDITIALLHWGSEYNDTVSDTQADIVSLMKKNGVDVIIGTHPHRVQELSFDESTGFFVAYSLGDFFGDGTKDGTKYSILLDLEITKDHDSGVTRVTDYDYTPLYILSESEGKSGRQVVRISETVSAYEVNFVDRVTASAYTSMQTSLTRINSRVSGKG